MKTQVFNFLILVTLFSIKNLNIGLASPFPVYEPL